MTKTKKGLVVNTIPCYWFYMFFFSSNHGLAFSAFSWANTVTFVALNSSPSACTQLLVSPQVSNAIYCALLSPNTSSALEKPPVHF